MTFLTPQEFFRKQGSSPRKRFGQHFLVQARTAERIVECAAIEESDVVVEIGPGLGALTRFLLPRVRRLELIELDRDLAGYLRTCIPESESRVAVHEQDVMQFDFPALFQEAGQPLVVIGNLPYNITSPLLFKLLEARAGLKRAVFMVQKEVGDRLSASPGTREYGVLSVLLEACGQVTSLFTVGPGQFHPPPAVDSVVLRIDFDRDPPLDSSRFDWLRRVVNAAFQQRRKTLRNSLKSLAGKERALWDEVFDRSRIDPSRRPETLTCREFLHLSECLRNGAPGAGPGE